MAPVESRDPRNSPLVARPKDWRWSSTHAFLGGRDDQVVRVGPGLERVGDFAALRRAESVGRPIGSREWLTAMEARLGRTLAPGKPAQSFGEV